MFDRDVLQAAASLVGGNDEPTRQAINHLNGISVYLLRFGAPGVPDENAVDAIRDSYHLRGWKHIVTTTEVGGPVRNGTTDVWVVMDGVNLRGAVVLAVDLLHLRGHFCIPRFDPNDLNSTK